MAKNRSLPAGFFTKTSARNVIRYTDRWDQDNIIQSKYKQITPRSWKRKPRGSSVSWVETQSWRICEEKWKPASARLCRANLGFNFWKSQDNHDNRLTRRNNQDNDNRFNYNGPSMATLEGRIRRTMKYKIRGYCKNPPKMILPENDTTEAPLR